MVTLPVRQINHTLSLILSHLSSAQPWNRTYFTDEETESQGNSVISKVCRVVNCKAEPARWAKKWFNDLGSGVRLPKSQFWYL